MSSGVTLLQRAYIYFSSPLSLILRREITAAAVALYLVCVIGSGRILILQFKELIFKNFQIIFIHNWYVARTRPCEIIRFHKASFAKAAMVVVFMAAAVTLFCSFNSMGMIFVFRCVWEYCFTCINLTFDVFKGQRTLKICFYLHFLVTSFFRS